MDGDKGEPFWRILSVQRVLLMAQQLNLLKIGK